MRFEWDEAKRISNAEKHKIDFRRARDIFDGRGIYIQLRLQNEEIRLVVTGELDSALITVIATIRGGRLRLISARKARDEEKWRYRRLYS